MRSIANILAVLCVACIFGSCETVTVTTDYDHSAPFSKYHTYTLAPPARGQTMSPTAETALREALRSELAARGITETSRKKADLDVVRHAFIRGKVAVQQYTDWGYGRAGLWPYGYGYYGMWPGAPTTYTFYNEYNEGTLVIDVVDARTKKLVFRGVAKAVVGGPEANAAKIREAVAKMMVNFPKSP